MKQWVLNITISEMKEIALAKSVLLILIGNRKESAVNVQKVLTAWGCNIKTRLGIHDGVLENCSDEGLLMLEIVGSEEDNRELARKVALIKGVDSKLVELEIEE
jgi:hypothetical protein